MDNLLPASKIAALKADELVAQIGREAGHKSGRGAYNCKNEIRPEQVNRNGESHPRMPKYYEFGGREETEHILRENMLRVINEVAEIANPFTQE